MKFLVFILTFVGVIGISKGLDFDGEIVKSFLNINKLRSGICFYCRQWPVNWFETIKHDFLHLSYFDVSNKKSFDRHKIFASNQSRIGITFDTTCNKTGDLFEKFSTERYFNASYLWLMLAVDFNASIQLLRSQDINLDAEITLAIAKNENSFDLFDVYNPNSRTNGKLVVNPIGQWTQESGYNVEVTKTKFERRSNLNGVTFRAVIIAHLSNTTLIPYLEKEDKLVDVPHRFNYNLFNVLQEKYNFRLVYGRSVNI